MKWSYGVTTVPRRRGNLFPRTLASLRSAGFDSPHLFVDGDPDGASWRREFGLEVTARSTPVRTAGHWCLSLAELYFRDPSADRFAVFQDDLVSVKNLRTYLEWSKYPGQAYLNLYTFPENEKLAPKDRSGGWYESNQLGRGAVALVFSREAVTKLMTSRYMADRPQCRKRGWRAIDGGVVMAMRNMKWKEYVHSPSLVQHTGIQSSMGNLEHPTAMSFPGEGFDAMGLARKN